MQLDRVTWSDLLALSLVAFDQPCAARLLVHRHPASYATRFTADVLRRHNVAAQFRRDTVRTWLLRQASCFEPRTHPASACGDEEAEDDEREKSRRSHGLDDDITPEPLRRGDGWADVIDTFTMYADIRRKVGRLLAEIDAG